MISKARLNPLAKKPPKGAIKDANTAKETACTMKGRYMTADDVKPT